MAITYKAWKPKYIELYSNKPPQIAPNRFMAMIADICLAVDNKVEKTIPDFRRNFHSRY